MKPDPQQNDPLTEAALEAEFQAELDTSMLGEALGDPAELSAQDLEALEQKVLALTDPQTMSLLDEALAPEASSDALADRILAATMPGAAIYSTATTAAEETPAVIGRITPSTWRYAAAAAITLAAGLGLWVVASQTAPTTDNRTADLTPPDIATPDSTGLANLNEVIAMADEEAALFDEFNEAIGSDLQALTDGLEDETIDRDTIWSDMDDYEQFLADLEADLG